MTDNCLDNKAQFRYLDSQLLQNIENEGTLATSSASSYEGRWTVYVGVSKRGKDFQYDAKHRLKQTVGGSLFLSRSHLCAEPSNSSRYVLSRIYCNKTQQEFTFGK
jgi:hypothetical protein